MCRCQAHVTTRNAVRLGDSQWKGGRQFRALPGLSWWRGAVTDLHWSSVTSYIACVAVKHLEPPLCLTAVIRDHTWTCLLYPGFQPHTTTALPGQATMGRLRGMHVQWERRGLFRSVKLSKNVSDWLFSKHGLEGFFLIINLSNSRALAKANPG